MTAAESVAIELRQFSPQFRNHLQRHFLPCTEGDKFRQQRLAFLVRLMLGDALAKPIRLRRVEMRHLPQQIQSVVFVQHHTMGIGQQRRQSRMQHAIRFQSTMATDEGFFHANRARSGTDESQCLDDVFDLLWLHLDEQMPHGRRFELGDAKRVAAAQQSERGFIPIAPAFGREMTALIPAKGRGHVPARFIDDGQARLPRGRS